MHFAWAAGATVCRKVEAGTSRRPIRALDRLSYA